MCRSTGALQVLHLATCYSRRGYPGRPRTLQPREPLVNDRFWCSAVRQTSLACVIGLGFAALSFCPGRAVGAPLVNLPTPFSHAPKNRPLSACFLAMHSDLSHCSCLSRFGLERMVQLHE
jgi:hypothetical protein